ncbi:MAG: hypothetical protein ACO3IW_04270, partial [Burkholderiales bacterium]
LRWELQTGIGTHGKPFPIDDRFVESVNIAKWQVWLACLSDLAVHAGILLRRQSGAPAPAVAQLMNEAVASILAATGVPADAGSHFVPGADRVRSRIRLCEWAVTDDDEAAFAQSPAALVQWAPVTEELKELDEEIVINSVRFRWHEVRRELQGALRGEEVLAGSGLARDEGALSK